MNSIIEILLLTFIGILLTWNIFLFYRQRKQNTNNDRDYFELNAKLNFITAVGSLAILIISYLGLNVKDEILKKSEKPINDLIQIKSNEIDSLLANKNILKAGIYIVTNIDFKANKQYRFKDLLTIDRKPLPSFTFAPKLIISTNTGENLRIIKITSEYFVLGTPLLKNNGFLMLSGDNPQYPDTIKFDIWIADYKTD